MSSPSLVPAPAQLELVRARVRRTRPAAVDALAPVLPVARVALDVSLPHLDRAFDYAVPQSMSVAAVAGARVRARLAGRQVDGFVLERLPASDFAGRLDRLSRVISAEPVLAPEVTRLARAVADRYAGTLADVLRLAVPPRVARVEREPTKEPARPEPGPLSAVLAPSVQPSLWQRYAGGPQFLAAVARGESPRAVWSALPGQDWPVEIALAVRACLAGGRGAVIIVPDRRDLDRMSAALVNALGQGAMIALTAELGPAERYRRWLSVRRGSVRVVVGTRAAMFAPVQDLGLVVVWDDGDDLHAEPRAPYPHVREVLALRAHHEGAALLVAGFSRTAESEQLLRTGWARPLDASRAAVRAAAPRVLAGGGDAEPPRDVDAAGARLPGSAWSAAKAGLERGPVLVQVPRRGYLPGLACRTCRQPACCAACAGPLALSSAGTLPACAWCAQPPKEQACSRCGDTRLRALAIGSRRTAEELGRAFPAVRVHDSAGGAVLDRVGAEPALVVATPGAEPLADGGYAAALLLDGWVLLASPDLRSGEETLRRWMAAAALVRPAADGGVVVVVADSAAPAVQALIRWHPAGFAARELADRAAARLPPAARVATATGALQAIEELVAAAPLPPSAQLLGPAPVADGEHRVIVRVPRWDGPALASALRAAQGVRSARKDAGHVRVRVDPTVLA